MILREESSLEQLVWLSKKIKRHINKPSVVVLTGEMGSGKTTFVRAFADYDSSLSSPTYSLINVVGDIVHADFCRVESEKELDYLEMSLYSECQYAFIEWGRPFLQYIKSAFGTHFTYYDLEICESFVKTSTRSYVLLQC